MTDKIFPPEFISAWNVSFVKAAFVQENEPIAGRSDCTNCGGRGFFATFIASKGPFNSPSSALEEVSHFYNGKWWIGKHITATCPVCAGMNNVPVLVEEKPATKPGRPVAVAEVLKR